MQQRAHYDIRLPLVRETHQQTIISVVSESLYGPLPRGVRETNDTSPVAWKRTVRRLAIFFQREFEYDFVQYAPDEDDPDHRAFVWTRPVWDAKDDGLITLGAACFRFRKNEGWGAQWIWLHPYARRQGLLSTAWPYFCNRFGDFDVESPLSEAMETFVRKMEHKNGPYRGIDPAGGFSSRNWTNDKP